MNKVNSRLIAAAIAIAFCASAATAQTVGNPFSAPKVRLALDYLKATEPDTINDQIKTCEIPAPTFKEEKRAGYFKQRFTELGLKNVRIDAVGNVIGEAELEIAVLPPATTGTPRTMPVARPLAEPGTTTTSTAPAVLLCSIGDSVKLPLTSATVAFTTTPLRSA